MKGEDFRLCICSHRFDEHDRDRCDKRCTMCDCVSFRLCAHQPQETLVHRHSHGSKPGKGMTGSAISVSGKKRT